MLINKILNEFKCVGYFNKLSFNQFYLQKIYNAEFQKIAIAEIKSHKNKNSYPTPGSSSFIRKSDSLLTEYKETPPAPKVKVFKPNTKGMA